MKAEAPAKDIPVKGELARGKLEFVGSNRDIMGAILISVCKAVKLLFS